MSTTQNVLLCSGLYQLNTGSPVKIFSQILTLDGRDYVWIDGIGKTNCVLVPTDAVTDFKALGTLRDYLKQARHFALGTKFSKIFDLCVNKKKSATVLVRSLEMIHSEKVSPSFALNAVVRQGNALLAFLPGLEK